MVDTSPYDDKDAQAAEIMSRLRRHPRIDQQGLLIDPVVLGALQRNLPFLVPFMGQTYHGVLPILDWDHRLPSAHIILRLYAYYNAASMRVGERSYQAQMDQISRSDTFPEFDVPDFGSITADETYEAALDEAGEVVKVQLVSEWSRNITPQTASAALQVVRSSEEYKRLSAEGNRPEFLGDLEAAKWMPPCEGEQDDWTVDVWYFTEYNGVVARGLSFLVDRQCTKVLNIREFVLRTN